MSKVNLSEKTKCTVPRKEKRMQMFSVSSSGLLQLVPFILSALYRMYSSCYIIPTHPGTPFYTQHSVSQSVFLGYSIPPRQNSTTPTWGHMKSSEPLCLMTPGNLSRALMLMLLLAWWTLKRPALLLREHHTLLNTFITRYVHHPLSIFDTVHLSVRWVQK